MTEDEREEISRGIAAGLSGRAIAGILGRAPSTVTREIDNNGGRSRYRAGAAERRACRQARRPQLCKLAALPRLACEVDRMLGDGLSPEEVSGWLAIDFPGEDTMRVSHETIYRTLYVQGRGALRKELASDLRRGRAYRVPRTQTTKGHGRGQIPGAVPISERPAEVADRAVPGHWEGDLIAGKANTWVATLVERNTCFLMMAALDSKESATVARALATSAGRLPAELYRTLTWDRRTEMSRHAQFTVDTGIQVYFCDPQSPRQRGTNENTNGLIRQYLPKGTDLSVHTQNDLNTIAAKLNSRPRKTHGFYTPAEKLEELLR